MALLTGARHGKSQTRREVHSFKFRAAVQRQCHLATPTLPLAAQKPSHRHFFFSRGKKSICFIFTKPYSRATSVSVLSKEGRKENNKSTPRRSSTCNISASASVMSPLVPLLLGARRGFCEGLWGCLDKSLHQNEAEMEHALVMMWNLMFAFRPAGKRGFRLVIFPCHLSLARMPVGNKKDAGAENAHRG